MTHFFVSAEQVQEGTVEITGPDFNHLKNVLRMKPGEKLSVSVGESTAGKPVGGAPFDGGKAQEAANPRKKYLCEVREFTEDAAALTILSETAGDSELPVEITLFQGIPKGDKLENIIQKSVELGASAIVPVAMKRCVAKIEPKKEEARLKRYEAISEAAAKQSKRDRIPTVGPVMNLKEAVMSCKDYEHIFVPYEDALNMAETRAAFETVRPGERVAVFIGPEGGFEPSEVAEITAAGGKSVTLGKRILRTETAGPAVLAMLVYLLEP